MGLTFDGMTLRALLPVLFLALATAAQAEQVRLGPSAILTGGDYTTGGGLTVAVEPRAIGGKLALCGVWAQSEAMPVYTRRVGSRVLAKGAVMLGGRVVARNLGFLRRVRPSSSYAGLPAGCTVLNRPWSAAEAAQITVRIPRHKVFQTSSPPSRHGPQVFFIRSDSPNPALSKGSFLPANVTDLSRNRSQY